MTPQPGQAVQLENGRGCRARISTLGCALLSLEVPGRDGRLLDVVLGYDHLDDYLRDELFLGCVVGRYAGRIDGGCFPLEGRRVQLPVNASGHHLHGNLHRCEWRIDEQGSNRVSLSCVSPAGEGGFPGELVLAVSYLLDEDNALQVAYQAKTDQPTVVNLSHHAYFNLAGHDCGNVMDHHLVIRASRYAPLREDLIPAGDFASVRGTPLDFLHRRRIGEQVDSNVEQLRFAGGYDHAWLLDGAPDPTVAAARLYAPDSGIGMLVYTDQPTIQFYSGNNLPPRWRGKGGALYGHRQGLCLETQHLPDSPNHPEWPSTLLRPGDRFRSSTRFQFTRGESGGP